MKRTLWALSILVLCCGVVGCGGGPVSERSARTAFENSTAAIKEGKAKLISFRKTNARSGELLGVKMYEVEYEAELQFLEDFPPQVWQVTGHGPGAPVENPNPSRFGPSPARPITKGQARQPSVNRAEWKTVKVEAQTKEEAIAKGTEMLPENRRNRITAQPGVGRFVLGPKGKKSETKQETGNLTFEQTEKGWRGPDKNIY
jgi:hypothetical protein